MLNCYNLSLVAENNVLPRRDFVKAMSNFIGNSRQKYLVQLDDKDPSSYIIYSTPISINDILIKRMFSSGASAIVTKSIVTPFDVVKTYVQVILNSMHKK